MAGENKQLIDLLEAEFENYRSALPAEEQGKFRTVKDMAKFLGIDAALLSRLRGGNRPVNDRLALQFAMCFYPGNEADMKALISRLLNAKPPEDGDTAVEKWFEDRGDQGFFLGVAFFEPPALRTNDKPGRAVATAVAKGMSYAILYPFAQGQSANRHFPEPLQDYLRKIWRGIRGLYRMLLSTALELKREEWEAGDRKTDLKSELERTASRVRVYDMAPVDCGSQDGYSAIPVGYRLFYARDHRGAKAVGRELWQWNTTSSGSTMLQRHADDVEKEAVEALMYPLPQIFDQSHSEPEWSLPDDNELQNFVDRDPITVAAWNLSRKCGWKLAHIENISVEEVINHELAQAARSQIQNAAKTGGRP